MGVMNILYSRIFFDWVFICFIRMVYPKKVSFFTAPEIKVKLIIRN